ncbi:MAG: ATP synthase F0 subunit C [Proteobacteria bacterium]|jgi:F-type H+-transporting ATPase subunit c|nr:ATP synthase F0 subunit C [Pseudomonadota bacterium]
MNKWNRVLPVMVALLMVSGTAFGADDLYRGYIGIGAGFCMGGAVLGGALAQSNAARGVYESISRNPQAAGKLNAPFYVGMAFMESLVLFALVVAMTLVTKI